MYEKQILADMANIQQGLYGPPKFVTNTSANTMKATSFYILEDNTRVASITINEVAYTDLAAIDLKAGIVLYGIITSVTLSRGSGVGYAGEPVTA